MTNAQKARQEALAMLFELYSPEHQQHGLRFVHSGGWGSNVIGIKQNILKLAPLGRTDRWQHTLARWVSMVDDAHTPQTLRWAFIQGSVYASHAS